MKLKDCLIQKNIIKNILNFLQHRVAGSQGYSWDAHKIIIFIAFLKEIYNFMGVPNIVKYHVEEMGC